MRNTKSFCWIFIFSFSKLGPVQTGRPRRGEGEDWESESLRVFNTRQESGNGTRELRTGSRPVPQYGTRIRDRGPALPAIATGNGRCLLNRRLCRTGPSGLVRQREPRPSAVHMSPPIWGTLMPVWGSSGESRFERVATLICKEAGFLGPKVS